MMWVCFDEKLEFLKECHISDQQKHNSWKTQFSWERKTLPGVYWKFPSRPNRPGKCDHIFVSWMTAAIDTVI